MAKSANSANIKRDQEGPDFRGAIDIVRNQLRNNDAEQKGLAQDNATLFTRIEKQLGVHKGAAKTFSAIDRMSPEKRTDYLRSLLGMLGVAGYDNFNDLVDLAQQEQKTVDKKPGGKPPANGKPPKAAAPDALEPTETLPFKRVNLKSGWLQQTKPDADLVGGIEALSDDDWVDVREATPEELAEEREARADFGADEAPGNVHPFPASKH